MDNPNCTPRVVQKYIRKRPCYKARKQTSTEEPNSSSLKTPPSIFLSDDETNTAKCTKCNNYLSIPPIVNDSNNIVCGRCVEAYKLPEDNRAYFYENLAKFMFFPCRNDAYGCSVKIPWGKVLDHEIRCSYERIICPAIGCESKVINDDVMKHFETYHHELILGQNQYHFSKSEDQNTFENKLFSWKNKLFIIHTRTDNGNIFFRIARMKGHTRKLLLQLKGKSTSSLLVLDHFTVTKYDLKLPTFSDAEKIDINTLEIVLGAEITCTFTFDDDGKSVRNTDDNKLYSEMECPICTAYMRPPIHMCNTGHSLCRQCREKLQRCPSCSSEFSGSRNYSLEKIGQIIKCPCKSKDLGCDFVGNINTIAHHESILCSLTLSESKISCIANRGTSCSWIGNFATAFQHISSTHPNLCSKPGSSMTIDISTTNNDTKRFLLYDRRVFALDVKFDADSDSYGSDEESGNVSWAITCISTEKVPDHYTFFLEIIRGNRILSINGNCDTADPKTSIPPRYINISKSLLDDFILQNTITFKINISNTGRTPPLRTH
uniref:RING-type E3 ubiquitin transferase n=1 Tax=Anoplophora glabripennis TaxID=217634 RepID=V5G8I2_ANOGL